MSDAIQRGQKIKFDLIHHPLKLPCSDVRFSARPPAGIHACHLNVRKLLTRRENFRIAKALCLRRAVGQPMKLRRLFLVVPFMLVGVWAAPSADEVVLPEKAFPQLDAILKTAVQQSPRMLNRALDLEIAENNRVQARAGLLPTVGGSASYRKAWDDRNDTNGRKLFTKTYYDFAVTQPVYYWGERRNNARIGEIQSTIAKGSYREAYRLLCQEIRFSYFSMIAQKLTVKRMQFALTYANTQLAEAEDRLKKRVISDAEIFPIRLAAEQAQIYYERSLFDFNNYKTSFARLAGITEIPDENIPDSVPAASYNPAAFDALLAGYLAQKDLPTVEAVAMRQQLDVQNLTYENSKTALRPKFNFIAGTSQDEQSFTINVAQKYKVNSLYAGLSVSWTIFDSFYARAGMRNVLARRRQSENEYRSLTERLTTQAQTQVKTINFAARNMSITDRYLESGEGNLRVRREEFKRGVRSEAEVSLAQIAFYDAQINAINSRADFLIKSADFLGTITEDPVLANVVEK